jgi:hypothetical protein
VLSEWYVTAKATAESAEYADSNTAMQKEHDWLIAMHPWTKSAEVKS